MRLLTTVIVAAVVLGGFTQRVSAEHHHQAFWDYLAGGSWEYEWKGVGTFPDGRQFETAYTITITSDERMEIESSGTVGGKPYTASAVFEKTK